MVSGFQDVRPGESVLQASAWTPAMLDMIRAHGATPGCELRPLSPLLSQPRRKALARRAKGFPRRDENGFNVLATWWVRGPDHNGLRGFATHQGRPPGQL